MEEIEEKDDSMQKAPVDGLGKLIEDKSFFILKTKP